MKRYVVTGGAGFIGSALVRGLLREGAGQVTVIDNLLTGKEENLAEVAGRIEQLRSDARFEPPSETAPKIEDLEEPAVPKTYKPGAPSLADEEKPEEESYTERLLRAKKKVWDGREKDA